MATALTRPFSTTANRARCLVTAVLLLVTLGACASPAGEGKDDPLPVKSHTDDEAWTQQLTEHVARSADSQIDPATVDPFFSPCMGKNGETAPDDRYILIHGANATVPVAQHPEAVRRIRAMPEKEGLTIEGHRKTVDGVPDAVMHAPGRYPLSVDSVAHGEDRMALIVITPCLVPPASPTP